jgi:hypothetical protein
MHAAHRSVEVHRSDTGRVSTVNNHVLGTSLPQADPHLQSLSQILVDDCGDDPIPVDTQAERDSEEGPWDADFFQSPTTVEGGKESQDVPIVMQTFDAVCNFYS